MKSTDDVTTAVRKRLSDTWHLTVLAEHGALPPCTPLRDPGEVTTPKLADEPAAEAAIETAPQWPRAIPLGRPSSAQAAADFGRHIRALHEWRDWTAANGLELVEESRVIAGSPQQLALRVVVPTIDTAAALAGDGWPDRLSLARARTSRMLELFPAVATDPALRRTLRAVEAMSELDFEICCQAATWFAANPDVVNRGLTPRQVPLPGVHAKWLNKHQAEVAVLAGLTVEDGADIPEAPEASAVRAGGPARSGPSRPSRRSPLGLLPGHPPRVHFTYLDPTHLAGGGRRHDSYSVGDVVALPYTPQVVVISENKDTAVGFPPVARGVAVEGAGAGGATIAAVPWIRHAPLAVYWGDMDGDGLAILDEFRARGLDIVSMLMDTETYETYHRFGTNHAPNGQPLKRPTPRTVTPRDHLRGGERDLYDLLTSGQAPYLRVEQERIPLTVAAAELARLRTASCATG